VRSYSTNKASVSIVPATYSITSLILKNSTMILINRTTLKKKRRRMRDYFLKILSN
jgi:hypothetical protein